MKVWYAVCRLFKMDRKINLAKIGKNAQIARAFASPTKNEAGQTSTASPFFSPVANRTRGNRKDKNHDEKAGVRQLHTDKVKLDGISEPMKAIQKKLAAGSKKATERKHIKIESDESEKPTTSREVKKEIKEEPDQDEKVVKKGAKRKSNDKKAAGIKTEPDVNDKENGGDDGGGGVSEEKQTKWEPNNWRQLLANIREMRKERNAPVDTMGCDKCYDEHTDEKTKRFHHLVALMLSSQTKDAVTYDAMSRLKRHGLTPQKMIETSTDDLQQLLYPVGFYKTKAKHIQQTSQILIDKFDSDIPNDIKGLISLPGITTFQLRV